MAGGWGGGRDFQTGGRCLLEAKEGLLLEVEEGGGRRAGVLQHQRASLARWAQRDDGWSV